MWNYMMSIPGTLTQVKLANMAAVIMEEHPSPLLSLCVAAKCMKVLTGSAKVTGRDDAVHLTACAKAGLGCCITQQRVRITAHDRHAGLRQTEVRADHMDDALALRTVGTHRNLKVSAIALQHLDLQARHVINDSQTAVGRRDGMVGRGDGAVWTAHANLRKPQLVEGLRARDLLDEMEITEDQVVSDEVVVPDLSNRSACSHGRDRTAGTAKREILSSLPV
jgi:hypothetical protein